MGAEEPPGDQREAADDGDEIVGHGHRDAGEFDRRRDPDHAPASQPPASSPIKAELAAPTR